MGFFHNPDPLRAQVWCRYVLIFQHQEGEGGEIGGTKKNLPSPRPPARVCKGPTREEQSHLDKVWSIIKHISDRKKAWNWKKRPQTRGNDYDLVKSNLSYHDMANRKSDTTGRKDIPS